MHIRSPRLLAPLPPTSALPSGLPAWPCLALPRVAIGRKKQGDPVRLAKEICWTPHVPLWLAALTMLWRGCCWVRQVPAYTKKSCARPRSGLPLTLTAACRPPAQRPAAGSLGRLGPAKRPWQVAGWPRQPRHPRLLPPGGHLTPRSKACHWQTGPRPAPAQSRRSPAGVSRGWVGRRTSADPLGIRCAQQGVSAGRCAQQGVGAGRQQARAPQPSCSCRPPCWLPWQSPRRRRAGACPPGSGK